MMGGGFGGGRGGGRGGGFSTDDLKGKIYDRRLYSRMLRYVLPYYKLVIISFVILMLVSVAEIVIPLIQRSAIDNYIVSDKTLVIYENMQEAAAFRTKYHYLKLKEYEYNGRHFVILNTRDRNKLDKGELMALESKGITGKQNFFMIPDNQANRDILKKYILQIDSPGFTQYGMAGWFKISDDLLVVERGLLQRLPNKARLTLRKDASTSLLHLALIFLSIILFRMVSSYFQSVITAKYSQLAMNDLRHDVFAHLQRMPVKYYDQNPVGRLVTRVTNDVRAIDEMLASGVITIIQDVVLVIGIVALMLVLDVRLALISFIILPFVIFTIAVYRTKTRVVYRDVRKYLAQLNATLSEHIAGQKIIQLFNQYFAKRNEFSEINQTYFLTAMKQLRLFAFFRPIIHVSSQMAVALIIWYGGGQILRNAISIGLLMAFTQYITKLFEPINDFSEKFNTLQGALAGAERIFDLIDQPADDYRDELKSEIKFAGEIEFQNVWLAYNQEEWVLKDISFKIRPGEKLALVGHTGSGKTSIASLLLGLYPYQKGKILIDGKELHQYALEDLRRNIGIVQQDVFIFSGNIKDNIALSNTDLTDEEIVEVSTHVNADKFIHKLPHKYDEAVMERGATLSTGQRQLIAFARVLAYNPAIFILDEATSNIDTETEILIQDALKKIIEDRTSIMIAHRLSTIQHVDRILVLHKGEIVEEGSHYDLLDKKGLYYDLYRLQYT